MLMNPKLQGILTNNAEDVSFVELPQVPTVTRTHRTLACRVRLLMTLLPVPVYCGIEALVGIENANALWPLLLTPVALLWYVVDYFLHSHSVRHVAKEVAHYGLFLTPVVTLFVAGLQPTGQAWPLAKSMLLWGEFGFCSILLLVLWRNRQVLRK